MPTLAAEPAVTDDADAGVPPSAAGAPLSAATQAWWAYDRPATFDVSKTEVTVPMRDGIKLACSLSRPAQGSQPASGQFPGLVVEYTPYALIVDIMIREAEFFAKRGYNALVCHVRGTGLSEESSVNDGFLKASHRNSDVTPEPVTPGTPVVYSIAIRAQHYRFVAGNSLRIRISGAASTRLTAPSQPVEITIQTGASSTLHMPLGF